MLIYTCQFFKIRVVFHMLHLWNEVGDPTLFCISDTSNSLSDCSKKFKKSHWLENFLLNVLKMNNQNHWTSCHTSLGVICAHNVNLALQHAHMSLTLLTRHFFLNCSHRGPITITCSWNTVKRYWQKTNLIPPGNGTTNCSKCFGHIQCSDMVRSFIKILTTWRLKISLL